MNDDKNAGEPPRKSNDDLNATDNHNQSTAAIGVRSAKDIKQGLLKKAIAQGRGPEMIKLILWRISQIRHHAKQDQHAIDEAVSMDGEPQSVRALNTMAYYKDEDVRFSSRKETQKNETIRQDKSAMPFIHQSPETIH